MPKQETENPTPKTGKNDDPTHIQYTGKASRRIVTAAQWAAAGIVVQEDSEWSFQNDFSVPITEFSSAQLDLLRNEGQFVGVVRE